jgi:hypothetical protein
MAPAKKKTRAGPQPEKKKKKKEPRGRVPCRRCASNAWALATGDADGDAQPTTPAIGRYCPGHKVGVRAKCARCNSSKRECIRVSRTLSACFLANAIQLDDKLLPLFRRVEKAIVA